ncbi:uncharacterized protein LOC120626033 [Pararge aegeria]|uniref:Jg17318 protein n=1 Tax=Pararge aegeria aegeria TaxID=348720 RepID=A0A8S4SQH6_9NEOP|nr:uncharacterized protein LOC120626033 [Pararge aegeria]CAH2269100.1 jg17318 [Pararge aegeria aegeria]
MDCYTLTVLACVLMVVSGWSFPFYPVHRVPQIRVTRFAQIPHPRRFPIPPQPYIRQQIKPIPKQPDHDYDYYDEEDDHNHSSDHDHNSDHNQNSDNKESDGVIGPVHTFVKTDKNANYKWGVRHHVGKKRTL